MGRNAHHDLATGRGRLGGHEQLPSWNNDEKRGFLLEFLRIPSIGLRAGRLALSVAVKRYGLSPEVAARMRFAVS